MGKINFTSENKARLVELSTKMLFDNTPIKGGMGVLMTIVDLLHNTTIGSLVTINSSLKKQIATMDDLDEWSCTEADKLKLERIKENQELVSLTIGYKKWLAEQEELEERKAKITAQIDSLKESQKTPAERITELEAQLSAL